MRRCAGDGVFMRGTRRLLAAGTVVFLCTLLAMRLSNISLMDLRVYRMGAEVAAHHGTGLYDLVSDRGYIFTYPPFAAIFLIPSAIAPWGVTYVGWVVLLAAFLTALWAVCARHVTWLPPAWVAPLVVLSLALEPVYQNWRMGQINLVLVWLVLVDLLRRNDARMRGFWLGVTIGVKLTPAVFLPFLVLTRQWKATGQAVLGFAATVAAGALWLPADSRDYWLRQLFDSTRIGTLHFVNNQSVRGTLVRLYGPDADLSLAWLALAGTAGLVCLVLAALWWRRDQRLLALGLMGLSALLGSPVSWTHHWVWCIPLGLALVEAARTVGLPTRAVWTAGVLWTAPFVVAPNVWLPRHEDRELSWAPRQHLLGETYLWSSLTLLVFLAWLLTRPPARPRGETPSEVDPAAP